MLKKIEKFFILTLFIVLIIILIIKVFFPNKINQIFKYNILIVQSNSMYPELEKGNILICKKQKEYEVGDIITFIEDKYLITHRVFDKKEDSFVTKGDYNNTCDEQTVTKENIVGKIILKIGKEVEKY